MRLEEWPLDIGYASERVTVKSGDGTAEKIGGQDGTTQLIVTAPFIDDALKSELRTIAASLPKGGEHAVSAALIVAEGGHDDPGVEGFRFYTDAEGEFGDFYGVRLEGNPYGGELTKALLLISKDGALYYDEFVTDLTQRFNTETLQRKILSAQICYTGKGCH